MFRKDSRGILSAGKTWLALGLLLLIPGQGLCGSLAVNQSASFAGSYGLEVTVDQTCSSPDDVVLNGETYSSTEVVEACASISADNVEITSSGNVTFRAGSSITLGDGFEVQPDAEFSAVIEQSLTPYAYLQDNSPLADRRYRLRFYIRPDLLSLGTGDEFDLFRAYGGPNNLHLRVILREVSGESKLALAVREDSGAFVATPPGSEIQLTSGWHAFELDWKASDPFQDNGYLDLWLDGQPLTGFGNLDNDLGQIDFVRWGLVEGIDASTTGIVDLDEFVSQRRDYIGLLP